MYSSPLPSPPTHTHWNIHWLAGAWEGGYAVNQQSWDQSLGCPRHQEVSVQRSSRWEESSQGPTERFEESWPMQCWFLLREHREAIRLTAIPNTRLCQSLARSLTSFYKSTVFQWGLYPAVRLLCGEENEHRSTVKRRREGNHPLHENQRERWPRSWQETLISRTRGHHRNPLILVLSFATLFWQMRKKINSTQFH